MERYGNIGYMEKQDRELYFARAVIGAIENVKVPMLMYEEEKEVVKKALQMYINKIEMDTRYAAKKMKNATRNYNGQDKEFLIVVVAVEELNASRVEVTKGIVSIYFTVDTNFGQQDALAFDNRKIR